MFVLEAFVMSEGKINFNSLDFIGGVIESLIKLFLVLFSPIAI